MNFRQLDLNLLRVLVAIHRTRSVTAAGKALALSQPATSNALARLREFFGDELFVRSPVGLQPTRLCEQLAPAMQSQLLAMESLVLNHQPFDALSSHRHWRLSLSDLGEILFLPGLAAALRSESPQASLSNISVDAAQVASALEARDIDMAIGILKPQHRGIRSQLLFKERYMAISSQHWSPTPRGRGKTLSLSQLAQARFVVVSPTATFHGSVEKMLTAMKLQDRILVRPRHFGAIAVLAQSTDLLCIVPEMYARDLSQRLQLQMWTIEEAPAYEVNLVWHASTDQDADQQWMRGVVERLFARRNSQVGNFIDSAA
jgi:DNA-binding transcriptional LysR family regulator